MSHFTVLVIGPEPEKQLQPYHEFACTGTVDEYVLTIDRTADVRKEYKEKTKRIVELPGGEQVCAYDDRFYREATPEEKEKHGSLIGSGGGGGVSWSSRDWGDGRGYRGKIHDTSLHAGVEKTVPYCERHTLREYVQYAYEYAEIRSGLQPDIRGSHKYGWVEIDADGEVVAVMGRDNPNHKWDWYLLGGRWTGFFPLKSHTSGSRGKPGLMTKHAPTGTADQCLWGDVDVDKARTKAEKEARAAFGKWRLVFEEHGRPISWSEAIDRHDKDYTAAREFYRAQPAITNRKHGMRCPVDVFGFDEAAYVAKRRDAALSPFAVVRDGKWFAKGDMGWWAAVSNDKGAAWDVQLAEMFSTLGPDTMVSLYDCHT